MFRSFFFSLILAVGIGLFFGHLAYTRLQSNRLAEQQASPLYKKDIKVTIVEGKRREEIAAQLDNAGVCEYQAFMNASKDLEGYLFPDTYRFFPASRAEEVVGVLQDNFQKKIGSVTQEELILASIVEREAVTDEERPLIAGVYQNRINANIKLDADPTVQYAKDNASLLVSSNPEKFKFWGPISRSDYSLTISQYNTYLNRGLPPGPISSPGLKSIEAAKNPAAHTYYYFLHKNGQLLLSRTLAEHESKQR